jgi:hypothetical protein
VGVHCSGLQGGVADRTAGLVQYGVSVTLEVSKEGKTRWFLTKESGLGPAWCGTEGCLGCQEGRIARGVAYAVLKTSPLSHGSGAKCSVGQSFLKPLCACSVKMLLQAASDVEGTAVNMGDITACVLGVKGALGFSKRPRRSGLRCGRLATLKCNLCAEYGSKWCAAGLYQCGERRIERFPWFTGFTDAVGTVEVDGARGVSWLSCPNRRCM